MRFKTHRNHSQMPEVNLVPMMDVVMTVLTFFIILSMTLTNYSAVTVPIPDAAADSTSTDLPEPLIVELNTKMQRVVNQQALDDAQLAQTVTDYLQQHPKGSVILKANDALTYEIVVQQLAQLRVVGGDSVSLAIE